MSRKRTLCLSIALLVLFIAVTPLAGAQEKVKITLWHHWGPNLTDLLEGIIADFEAQYPWIEVEHNYSSTAGAADRLGTMLVSGAAPEVVMLRSTYAFQFISLGGFLQLDELAARDNIDLSIFNPGDLRSFQFLGDTYAFPFISGSAWTNLMFYNIDMMDNAGLDSQQPPQTWNDWRNATLRMTEKDASGGVIYGGSQIPLLQQAVAWNGEQFWTDDWKTAQAVTPGNIETAEFMRDVLIDAYGDWSSYYSFYSAGQSFWEGRLGFYFTNNSGFALGLDAHFRWGATTAPVNSNNPNARPVNVISSTWSYAIPASISDDKLEAAWLLLKYLTTNEDGAGLFARAQGRPSPVIDFNRHPDYQFGNPYWHVVLEALQHEITAPPNVVGPMEVAGTDIYNGSKHPNQALADAEVKIQQALDAYWAALDN